MDVRSTLDEITRLVETAKSVPMSASCWVNRADMLRLIEQLREQLPHEMRQAETLISERDDVIDEGRREAERIIGEARTEASRLVSRTEVMQRATADAERVVTEAFEKADRMRQETEDYIDRKLGGFEVALTKTLDAVTRGRTKLSGRSELEALANPEGDAEPLPG